MRRLDREASPFHQAVHFVRNAIRGIGREGLETIGGLIALGAAVGVLGYVMQSEPDVLDFSIDQQVEVAPPDLPPASDVIEPDDACKRLRKVMYRTCITTVKGD